MQGTAGGVRARWQMQRDPPRVPYCWPCAAGQCSGAQPRRPRVGEVLLKVTRLAPGVCPSRRSEAAPAQRRVLQRAPRHAHAEPRGPLFVAARCFGLGSRDQEAGQPRTCGCQFGDASRPSSCDGAPALFSSLASSSFTSGTSLTAHVSAARLPLCPSSTAVTKSAQGAVLLQVAT